MDTGSIRYDIEGWAGDPAIISIDQEEADLLRRTLDDPNIKETLEIGCALGASSAVICQARRGTHTIIDPYQSTDWRNAGITRLNEMGADYELIEEVSEIALPELLHKGRKFDLVFIDGWHTFDQTFLDCFYATRLLRVGGYLVVDDTYMMSVRAALDYYRAYDCYKFHDAVGLELRRSFKRRLARVIPKSWLAPALRYWIFTDFEPRMIVLKKIGEDNRPGDWYKEF
jgi:predicted O-methyltransferase YrrM